MMKLTLSAAKKKFGSYYHIAEILDLNRSSVGRWGRYVPDEYVDKLTAAPAKRLKRGGKR